MKRTLFGFALVAICLPLTTLARGVSVDARQFIRGIEGSYRIHQAGGEKPKEENSLADVTADSQEGLFTMPFCGTNGLCDPGYLLFDYDGTRVVREDLAPGHARYSIVTVEGNQTSRYTWEDNRGTITFTNYQYKLGTQVTTLRHLLEKMAYDAEG